MWVPLLIAFSAALNIKAIWTPFMTISIYKQPTDDFNILGLINLMFGAGIIWPTDIIIAFSLVFPLFKLSNLLILWFLPWHCTLSRRWLRTLSYLGRFSYMDIFAELTVLNMAHNQGIKLIHLPLGMTIKIV
jgi:hypothetical protein